MVLISNEPAFQLERTSGDPFGISGLPPGITLQFVEDNHVNREVTLNLKGPPEGSLFRSAWHVPGTFNRPEAGQPAARRRRAPLAGSAPGVL